MPGVRFLHLGSLRPPSVSTASLLAPNPEPAPPLDPTPPTPPPTPSPKRRSGLLNKMAVPITWGPTGEQSLPTPSSTPHKLKKKKSVHFTPSAAGSDDTVMTPATPPPVISDTGLPTPEATPEKKKGVFGKIFTKSNKTPYPVILPSVESQDTAESWHHHASYFPEYEPIYKDPLIIPGVPGVRAHEQYFPTYTPLLTKNGHGPNSSAYAYALDPALAQAQAHAQSVGHNVVVHYPDLPKFAEYNGGKDGKGGWTSAQWGVEGWSGYGWQGDGTKLPDKDGNTFGAPMPKGQELPKEQKPGGQGGGQGGGSGGGSSKSKKKKNKKSGQGDDTHVGGGDKAEGDGEGGGDGDGDGGDE